uniref:Uncharacterized protein n=1 Tax=Vitis vinifera TaxID=29760 RepID=F6H4T1_VITVI
MGLMLESYSEDPKIVQEMTEIMPGWSNCSFQCFQGVGPVADVEKISSSSKLYKRELHNVLIKKLYG